MNLEAWLDEAWRDPYVFPDPGGDGWHMLITARVPDGPADGRGVIGQAHSVDLGHWDVRPPLTQPAGFGQLEVPQAAIVEGQPFLLFSCWPDRMDPARRAGWRGGGVWVAPGESVLGPWDIDGAVALNHPSLYAARLVANRAGTWSVLGFRDTENGVFIGEIADPLPFLRSGRTLRIVE